VKQLAPYVTALAQRKSVCGVPSPRASSESGTSVALGGGAPSTPEAGSAAEAWEAFRWLVEEFRVSLFAQELGTAEPVSPVKLDRVLAELKQGKGSSPVLNAANVSAEKMSPPTSPTPARAEPPAAPAPTPIQAVTTKKSAPLKNLGGLDSLFRR
jgi:ATP-dependent helicase HrpA